MEIQEGAEKRLLGNLLGQAEVTNSRVGVADCHILEPVDYGCEGFGVALPRIRNQRL